MSEPINHALCYITALFLNNVLFVLHLRPFYVKSAGTKELLMREMFHLVQRHSNRWGLFVEAFCA